MSPTPLAAAADGTESARAGPAGADAPLLAVRALRAGYGETRILHGVDVSVGAGQVTALLGRNGAGKTTTLKAIMGLIATAAGEVTLAGTRLTGRHPYQIAAQGVAYVPETRDVFRSLTVRENLEMPLALAPRDGARGPGAWTLEAVLALFPRLGERLNNGGNQLSGGEQQMLSIARALLQNPRVLLLDEPTEGLAPIIVTLIHDKLAELKATGITILLVEQNFSFATSLADHCVVLGRGVAQWTGTSAALRADHEVQHRWLGV